MRRLVIVIVAGLFLTSAAAASADTPVAVCTPAGGTSLPCGSGWYTTPVSVVWETGDASTTGGCESQYYSQDTNYSVVPLAELPQSAFCSFTSGTLSGTVTEAIMVEISSPTASGVASRAPDDNGWYNHPVTISWTGSAFSGLAACTAPQTWSQDTTGATLTGSCTDNAGKVAAAAYTLKYDATPPALSLSAAPGDTNAAVSWHASSGGPAPLTAVNVSRTPGGSGSQASVLPAASDAGSGTYSNNGLRNGVHYTYTVTATDQAGNTTVKTLRVTPGERLLTPAAGAHVTTPPTLIWTAVPRATYYNVQLYHDGKVLSAWPKTAHLRLARSWRYAGHTHRLRAGRYRWYVWPGLGKRSADRYGKEVGTGTFVVS